jgi:hypothetical protein
MYVVKIQKDVFQPDHRKRLFFFFVGKIPSFLLGVHDDKDIRLNYYTINSADTKQLRHIGRSERRRTDIITR